jgi:hypothetical protein
MNLGKNPQIKMSPKSPCTNFQSLCKFKNLIFIPKGFFSTSGPVGPATPLACSAFQPTQPIQPLLPPSAPKQGNASAAGSRRLLVPPCFAPPWKCCPELDTAPHNHFPFVPSSFHRVNALSMRAILSPLTSTISPP